jgi:hypothetical protein
VPGHTTQGALVGQAGHCRIPNGVWRLTLGDDRQALGISQVAHGCHGHVRRGK